jgi:hypothetical protein
MTGTEEASVKVINIPGISMTTSEKNREPSRSE